MSCLLITVVDHYSWTRPRICVQQMPTSCSHPIRRRSYWTDFVASETRSPRNSLRRCERYTEIAISKDCPQDPIREKRSVGSDLIDDDGFTDRFLSSTALGLRNALVSDQILASALPEFLATCPICGLREFPGLWRERRAATNLPGGLLELG